MTFFWYHQTRAAQKEAGTEESWYVAQKQKKRFRCLCVKRCGGEETVILFVASLTSFTALQRVCVCVCVSSLLHVENFCCHRSFRLNGAPYMGFANVSNFFLGF